MSSREEPCQRLNPDDEWSEGEWAVQKASSLAAAVNTGPNWQRTLHSPPPFAPTALARSACMGGCYSLYDGSSLVLLFRPCICISKLVGFVEGLVPGLQAVSLQHHPSVRHSFLASAATNSAD